MTPIPGLEAFENKIIVRQVKEDRSAGGIWLPDKLKGKEVDTAEVVAVSDGFYQDGVPTRQRVKCEPGDYVLVYSDGLMPFQIKGELFAIVLYDHVLCKLPAPDLDYVPPIPLEIASSRKN